MRNYTGNKGGQGIKEQLLNFIPVAERYFSFFTGGGGLEKCKELEKIQWITAEKDHMMKKNISLWSKEHHLDYRSIVEEYYFTKKDFIFADPPYLMENRKSGKKYYKNELDTAGHVELLNYIISIEAMIVITHPYNELYKEKLSMANVEFNFYELNYMTRNGWYKDGIWCNFKPADVELLTYNFIGKNRTERQRIKRRRKNMIRKIEELEEIEKKALLRELRSCIHEKLH